MSGQVSGGSQNVYDVASIIKEAFTDVCNTLLKMYPRVFVYDSIQVSLELTPDVNALFDGGGYVKYFGSSEELQQLAEICFKTSDSS